jgi:exodeoxyribonuclease VII small subunit
VKEKEAPSFEAALKQLEEIVQRLEKGELPLEDSLKLYEQGIGLARLCHEKLSEAEGRVELLLKDARGEPLTDAAGRPKTEPLPQDGETEF